MMRTSRLGWALVLILSAALPAEADVWDAQARSDNSLTSTTNTLVHGSDQLHDLEVLPGPSGDEDWYRIGQEARSSYEVVVDSTSGDIGAGSGPVVQRLGSDGVVVLQDSVPIGTSSSRSLRWENASAGDVGDQYIRVRSGGCTTTCGSHDVYRIRAYDTTYAMPRFNNSGSQITVLVLQNPASDTVSGTLWFWSGSGALLASSPFTLGGRASLTLSTTSLPGLSGQSGSVTVSNDGGYGELVGKGVALEPSTGFTFDTPMSPRMPPPASFASGTCQGKLDSRTCYTGPPATEGVGVCHAGHQFCFGGSYPGACAGEVLPSAESCNGEDDDCDGAVDNGLGTITCGVGACQQTVPACTGGSPGLCQPGAPGTEVCGDGIDNNCNGLIDESCACVYVAPSGNDANPGTAALPKRTIGAAIGVAGTMGLPNTVCVAAGNNCNAAPTTFDYPEAVSMRNGVHVYGGYWATGATWPRLSTCITRIVDQDQRGVYFDASVTDTTILDGFTIAGMSGPSAAVTVEGSTGAVVSNDVIAGGVGAAATYGVNVIDSAGTAARPTLSNNQIIGGNGAALAVGVRSLNSAPVIQANCNTFDASGRCSVHCSIATRFIRGRTTGGTGVESYGVLLEVSPGAVVDQNSICTNGNSTTNAAGVRLSGDATGTLIRANHISGSGGQQDAVGVWADPCAGASPWVLSNFQISASSMTAGARADGIRALGDCHVRIDHNLQIVGGFETANADTNGVLCARDIGSGVSSRCTILGNVAIDGSASGFPPVSAGVRCEDGACARIENNGRISGRAGQIAVGVVLGKTGTFVDANAIQGGCARTEGIGLLSNDSYARIQNNQISGVTSVPGCTPTPPLPASAAVKAILGAGTNEIDLNSNDLFAEGFAGACTSRGIGFDISGPAPAGPRGIVRNNIVVFAGSCTTNYGVEEMNASADPRVFENNDLWRNVAVPALYRDENATNLTTIQQVNALAGASGNISADPLYASGHLSPGSPCRNAGAAAGAPGADFEGDPRPQELLWDIGRDEFVP